MKFICKKLLLDEKAKHVGSLSKKKINVDGTVTKDGVVKKAHLRSQLTKTDTNPVVQAVSKHVDEFSAKIDNAFDKYDNNATPEQKQSLLDSIASNVNKYTKDIDVVAKDQHANQDAIKEKGIEPVNKYLETLFDKLNKDPKDSGELKPIKNLKNNATLHEAFLTNKKLQDGDLKNYGSAKVSYQLTVNAPSKVLKKDIDNKNVIDIADTPIGGAMNHLKKLKSHSQNPKKFNEAVTHVLDKATDKGQSTALLEKLQYGKDVKQTNTVLDYHVANGHTKELNGKMFKGEKFDTVGGQYLDNPTNAIANSQNPKKMQEFIEDNSRQTHNLRGEYNANALINDLFSDSNLPKSKLIKRGMDGVSGKKGDSNMFMPDSPDVPIFKQGGLSKDKLPDELNKNMSKIYENTQAYLKKNPDHFSSSDKAGEVTEKGIISRGMDLDVNGNVMDIAGGTASTTSKLKTAYSFTNLNEYSAKKTSLADIGAKLAKDGKKFKLSDGQKKYAKDAYIDPNITGNINSMGIVMNYDAKKMAQDGKIFALLDGKGFEHLQKDFPKLKPKYKESEAMAIF